MGDRKYIVRLDDACPVMCHERWHRMEALLNRYGVKPIVGVIPDSQDPEFTWPEDPDFWSRVQRWQEKGWTIAQHGLHHLYQPDAKRSYFQKSHDLHSEWAGRSYDEQLAMMKEGNELLHAHGLQPTCFFAPAHTYDQNTVEAVRQIKSIYFISDGYALHPYRKAGMNFLPSICDGPFVKMPFSGVYTFITHPNKMNEDAFARWEHFLSEAKDNIVSADAVLPTRGGQISVTDTQGISGHALEWGIYYAREVRKWLR